MPETGASVTLFLGALVISLVALVAVSLRDPAELPIEGNAIEGNALDRIRQSDGTASHPVYDLACQKRWPHLSEHPTCEVDSPQTPHTDK